MLVALGGCSSSSAAPIAFAPVAAGIEHASFNVPASPAFAGYAYVVDLTQVDVALVQPGERRRVSEISAPWPQHLAINASFFDPQGRTMGRAVDAGRVLSADRQRQWGALILERGASRLVAGDALPADAAGGELVVQGVPRLVVDGAVQKLKPASAVRTAVCAEGDRLLLVVTTAPADATEIARFLARPRAQGGLGCTNALNLDGGPSTQLNARLGAHKLAIEGGWGVPNALVVLPKSTTHEPTPAVDAGAAAAPDVAPGPPGAVSPTAP